MLSVIRRESSSRWVAWAIPVLVAAGCAAILAVCLAPRPAQAAVGIGNGVEQVVMFACHCERWDGIKGADSLSECVKEVDTRANQWLANRAGVSITNRQANLALAVGSRAYAITIFYRQ